MFAIAERDVIIFLSDTQYIIHQQFYAFLFKPADSKREEFRKYLEKTGVLDSLTKGKTNKLEPPTLVYS